MWDHQVFFLFPILQCSSLSAGVTNIEVLMLHPNNEWTPYCSLKWSWFSIAVYLRYARSETKGNLSKDIKLYCPCKIGEAKL